MTNGNGLAEGDTKYVVAGVLPPLYPEWLGCRSFLDVHRTRFAYVAGAMANGIATVELVVAMAEAGMLGFFGSAGLSLARVEAAIDQLIQRLGTTDLPWGSNLIHSPNEPALEQAVVDLYLARQVRRVSASAFMNLTPSVVQYACRGLYVDATGQLRRRNFVFAKISRPETARAFLSPPPAAMVEQLVRDGRLSP
ncbi:MAG: 2-nitropropane dioxygenase, partial [Myxococcota bacterium]